MASTSGESPALSAGHSQTPMVEDALRALELAAGALVPDNERQVRLPASWLIRRCWLSLVVHGSASAAIATGELSDEIEPGLFLRSLPQLARRAAEEPGLGEAVALKVEGLRHYLRREIGENRRHWAEQLLLLATSAVWVDRHALALGCLERLDQEPHIWPDLYLNPTDRSLLAETIGRIGEHPLTSQLIDRALLQYGEEGAQFMAEIAIVATRTATGKHKSDSDGGRSLLTRCVEVFHTATLETLLSRRHACRVFALDRRVDAVLDQLDTIASVQDARRGNRAFVRRDTNQLRLRQSRRRHADPDIDFQMQTIKEVVDLLPLQGKPVAVAALVERIVLLGSRSDGWTAATAAASLVHLDAPQEAIRVVEQLPPADVSRSEAYRTLVDTLYASDRQELAVATIDQALRWASQHPEPQVERLLRRHLAQVLLHRRQPDRARSMLDGSQQRGFVNRLIRRFHATVDADSLQEEGLRFYATLLVDSGSSGVSVDHLTRLQRAAGNLLEGKAALQYLIDFLLDPLLQTGRDDLLAHLLPAIQDVLLTISGRELPGLVESVALRLTTRLRDGTGAERPWDSGQNSRIMVDKPQATGNETLVAAVCSRFLSGLWEQSVAGGIWQTTYMVGGSIPLIIALAGADAVHALASRAAAHGGGWGAAAPSTADEQGIVTDITNRLGASR